MKIGNLSQTVWKRDIKKKMQTRRKEVLFPITMEEKTSALVCGGKAHSEAFVWADASVSGTTEKLGQYAILRAANDVAAKGAEPIGVSVQILSPAKEKEEKIVHMAAAMEAMCEKLNLQITCMRAEGSPSVLQNIVCVTVAGFLDAAVPAKDARPGREILLCGYAGLEGTLLIAQEAEEELGRRFTPSFLRQTKEKEKWLCTPSAIQGVFAHGAKTARQIGSGGILAALWELGECFNMGMEIEFSDILICQETVEICEYYQLNPYQMTSAGSLLITTDKSTELLAFFKQVGIRARRLGVITDANVRIITSGTEKRYLDRPAPDEWLRWQSDRE